MEGAFKTFFTLAVLIFCMVVIGIFFIILKVILMFQPSIQFMGLLIGIA
jgi:hypothetical protein